MKLIKDSGGSNKAKKSLESVKSFVLSTSRSGVATERKMSAGEYSAQPLAIRKRIASESGADSQMSWLPEYPSEEVRKEELKWDSRKTVKKCDWKKQLIGFIDPLGNFVMKPSDYYIKSKADQNKKRSDVVLSNFKYKLKKL
eukprot:TRINITY_DN3599_c0_g5_i1.p2 TRINITY_DN3599_c0_g5~~TRINITY_DN3599_c0_g5_i1.p2  ORF type:complete len:142 (+),score=28.00 TRINITY_DN3599_c0_g5_i1:553-978(+)